MELPDSFSLEAVRDYDYVPEAGGHWSDAYHPVPRVNPAYSPVERTAELRAWLECEWRDSRTIQTTSRQLPALAAPCCLRSSVIEQRFPKPRAQVRFLSGAFPRGKPKRREAPANRSI